MLTYPNAKINIGLNIINKRDDGFHNLETIFYPIEIKDALEITKNKEQNNSNKVIFSSSGLEINDISSKDNICVKAYNLLSEDYNIPNIKSHLHKVIPFGAGLGGGSADAAFMLKLINKEFNLKISPKKLTNYASVLGSDCAFFIKNTPCFATSRGEILKEINLDLSKYYFVLINPNIKISTPWAFQNIIPKTPKTSLFNSIQSPIKNWKSTIINDFEKPIFEKYPAIKNIKTELYKMGALYSSMSGSGSSVFAFFETKPSFNKKFFNYFIWKNF